VANKQAFDLNGRRTLRADATGTADGDLSYDLVDSATNPKGINWTATYTGLTAADQDRATHNETRALWLGANPLLGNEGTIYETALDGSIVPGPATPDCTSPLAQNAIGGAKIAGVPTSLVNQANVGGTLTISGPYDPDNVSVVALTVGGASVPVTLGANTWSASVPAASLPEGTVALTASFAAGGPVGGGAPDNTMTILKDTVAPGAPTVNLGSGTYPGPQTITLQSEPGTTIRFTGDGSTPTATSGVLFDAPFSVTSSQTIKAVAVDNHGNASAASTFVYTIGAGPVPSRQVKGTTSSALSVSRLALARRISITRVRARGLRVSMNLQEGTQVVRIAIYRARNGRKSGRALFITNRVPHSAGLYRVTLRDRGLLRRLKAGRHVIEVRAGQSRTLLGRASSRLFQIVP
jgi:hypothetical protein